MFNPDWGRWIFTSAVTHFNSRRVELPLFVEGSDKTGRRRDTDYAEFRLNGPFYKELSKDYWYITIDINVLVITLTDPKDAFKCERNIGKVCRMFDDKFSVFKLGDEPQDTKQFLECAIMEMEGLTGGIQTFHYGKVDPTVAVVEASVEATYKLYLSVTKDDTAIFLSVKDVVDVSDGLLLT